MPELEQCAFEALLHHMVRVKQFFLFSNSWLWMLQLSELFFCLLPVLAGRTIAPRSGGGILGGTPNRPGLLNCPTTLNLGHASYKTTTQDSLSMADRKIQ